MRASELINEVSPNNLGGSFTRDLLASKLWLCDCLKKIKDNNSTAYILGSWYGNLAWIMQNQNINFPKLILVDKDPKVLSASKKILRLPPKKSEFLNVDAKDVVYKNPCTVINTSVNDMSPEWYDAVPEKSIVVVQSRNNIKEPHTRTNNMRGLDKLFPMTDLMYSGSKSMEDPETEYTRYMKIGIK